METSAQFCGILPYALACSHDHRTDSKVSSPDGFSRYTISGVSFGTLLRRVVFRLPGTAGKDWYEP